MMTHDPKLVADGAEHLRKLFFSEEPTEASDLRSEEIFCAALDAINASGTHWIAPWAPWTPLDAAHCNDFADEWAASRDAYLAEDVKIKAKGSKPT